MLCLPLLLALAPQEPAAGAPAAGAALLLVIAPQPLLAATQPLVELRRREGLRAEAVALTEALAGDGADDAEKLKRYLFARSERDRALRYVLLVGDADVMPVRFMVLDRCTPAAFDYAFYPSDLYYADLRKRDGSFEDWNATRVGFHRGYYGEVRGEKNKRDPINFDDIDYLPELAVGRWPVDTVAEVERAVQKTVAFSRWVAAGGGRSALLLGVPGWIEARPLLQGAAAALPKDWEVQRLWWQDGPPDGRDAAIRDASRANVLEAWNRAPGLVLHAGHGSEHGFDKSLGLRDVAALQNAQPAIAMSIGCTTARLCTLPPYEPYVDVDGHPHAGTDHGEVFTAPPPPPAVYQRDECNGTSFGEQLVRGTDRGAVAYLGCDTGGQPCAATLLAAFAQACGDGAHAPRLGAAWAFAVAEYWRREHLADLRPNDDWYPPSIFFQAMKYLLLGDPSLPLPGRAAAPPAGEKTAEPHARRPVGAFPLAPCPRNS
jgi:Peptidase family C25